MFQLLPSRTVAVQLFHFPIHWYGILYVVAFVCAIVLLPRLQKLRGLSLSTEAWMDVISWAIVGVLVGGRLGYVVFYDPSYFLASPWKVFAVWEGGMASHGGFIGVALALAIVSWKKKLDLLRIADILTVPAGIGLALGRIGNFINQELYGTVTTLPWGIAIPGVPGLRHPVSMYEMLADLAAAIVCYGCLRAGKPAGRVRVFAVFLMSYGIYRFLLEYLREQAYPWTVFGPISVTRGQLLTIPLFLAGVILFAWKRRSPAHS
jgi:phosphatidylglycerol:prolipoprotein diacylglycerol transferase